MQKQTQYNKIRKGQHNERYKHIKTEILIEYLEKEGRRGRKRLIARARCGNLEEVAGEGEKKMRTISGRRMCSDTQGTHPSRRGGVRKNKHKGGGMVKRRGKRMKRKTIEVYSGT